MQPTTLPSIPNVQELYDTLMAPIEPELTSGERPKLKAKYRYESPDHQDARHRRYAAAFRKYYTALGNFVDETTRQFKSCWREDLRTAEAEDRANEGNDLERFIIPPPL